ncbi:hypothetical protein C0992_002089, partial [Termitomyces sp. T32_za158]
MDNGIGAVRSRRPAILSKKLADPDNIGDIQLSSHQASRKEALDKTKGLKRSSATAELDADDPGIALLQFNPSQENISDVDTEIDEIQEIPPPKPHIADRTRDVDQFFSRTLKKEGKNVRECRWCSKKQGHPIVLVSDVSTLRRHLQSAHKVAYRDWCAKNNFESRLPKDIQARKDKAEVKKQSRIEEHLTEQEVREKVHYSDQLFREVAVEWLVSTDQPIGALNHPKFHQMIHIASQAKNGIKIPDRCQTRQEIMSSFKKQMNFLRTRLNSFTVQGVVNLTCDAWQASNVDGYFAVTGTWIEEAKPREWETQTALLGFVRLNNAHNGRRLGKALFKVASRLGIAHK